MKLSELIAALEEWAPPMLQESYDNSGLIVGDPQADVRSAMVSLDCTEAVVEEAVELGCDVIISHHPILFKGLKSLAGNSYVERTIRAALKNGIALYAIHTNLDNVLDGVNGEIATRLGLKGARVLDPKPDQLRKLAVFVPMDHAERIRNVLFKAGAGAISAYDECSFSSSGHGTFRPLAGADPHVGVIGTRHTEKEERIEVIYPAYCEGMLIRSLLQEHPYEEVAYDLVPLLNRYHGIGSGLVGEWETPMPEKEFLALIKSTFGLELVRHTALLNKPIKRVALCGGSGAFLIKKALAAGADAYLTGDVKYHEFFDADGGMLLADIGHYGSEQYTMHLIQRKLAQLFPTFAVRLTKIVTDPIYHY